MRGRLFLIALIAVIVGAQPARAQLEKPNLTLAVGGKTLVAYLPLTIAERLGLFEKEGLKVTINDFAGGSRALQSLVGGSADVVCGSYEHTILMRAKGVNIKSVALHNNSLGTVIGLTPEKAKSYRAPKDLAGLKIGVTSPGSASSLGVALLLARGGLTLDKVSIIGVGTGASAVAAMKSGQIDGMSNFDPAILLLERDKLLVPVVNFAHRQGARRPLRRPDGRIVVLLHRRLHQAQPPHHAGLRQCGGEGDALDRQGIGRRNRRGRAGGVLRRRRPRGVCQDDRTQPRRVHQGARIEPAWAETTYRAVSAHEEVLKNVKVDLKERTTTPLPTRPTRHRGESSP